MRRSKPKYDSAFFEHHANSARRSAQVLVPELLRLTTPESVVDVGCGTGGWLAVFAAHGLDDYTGLDSAYAISERLEIPRERFTGVDLTTRWEVGREFDLAISLEVAEHLPKSSAEYLVYSLTRLAPMVAFSAAVPGQGGTDHLHERWPDYWATLFLDEGFVAVDALRPVLWDEPEAAWWYAQNAVLYARRDRLAALPDFQGFPLTSDGRPRRLVHPGMHQHSLERERWVVTAASNAISGAYNLLVRRLRGRT